MSSRLSERPGLTVQDRERLRKTATIGLWDTQREEEEEEVHGDSISFIVLTPLGNLYLLSCVEAF